MDSLGKNMEENKDLSPRKYDELDSEQRNYVFFYIIRCEDILRNLYLGSVERGIKALFLLNAGGTVTVLTYISNKIYWAKFLSIISLATFLIGLLLAVIVVFYDFKFLYQILEDFKSDINKYFKNEIPLKQIRYLFLEKKGSYKPVVWCAYISTFCIPVGILFGLLGYFI